MLGQRGLEQKAIGYCKEKGRHVNSTQMSNMKSGPQKGKASLTTDWEKPPSNRVRKKLGASSGRYWGEIQGGNRELKKLGPGRLAQSSRLSKK